MRRANLARLGVLVAVAALPACSGGGASAPIATNSVATATSVRQRTSPDSLIGSFVHATTPVSSAGSAASATTSLIGSTVPLTLPVLNPASLIGSTVHITLPVVPVFNPASLIGSTALPLPSLASLLPVTSKVKTSSLRGSFNEPTHKEPTKAPPSFKP
jgi:hypothetical protein